MRRRRWAMHIHAADRRHLIRGSIKNLEAHLDPEQFVRIHRSAIVNVDLVHEIRREGRSEGSVLMAGGQQVGMSTTGWRKLLALTRTRG